MCFSSPKIPAPIQPNVLPAITETFAPEAKAPVFGGTEKALMDSAGTGETKGKTGISSLKVKPVMRPAATGANDAGLTAPR